MKPVQEEGGRIVQYPTAIDVKSEVSKNRLYTWAKEYGEYTHVSSGKGMTHSKEYHAARFAARAVAFALIDEAVAAGASDEILEKLRSVQIIMAP